MRFGIIEVGSTNTKGYIYENNKLNHDSDITILLKLNYQQNQTILDNDFDKLCEHTNQLKQKVDKVYVYGTSIFRSLSDKEKEDFISKFTLKTDCSFSIVSSDDETKNTVYGVVNNIDYQGTLAVIIGGGGSNEIAIVKNKEIVDIINLDFGAMDLIEEYKDLVSDIPNTDFDEIVNYIKKIIGKINYDVDAIILAGGDYLYFYLSMNYELEKNTLYSDINQPYMLNIKESNKIDFDYYYRSLDEIKQQFPDKTDWWHGTRAMRMIIHTIGNSLKTEYVIPTRINMTDGLVQKIIENDIKNVDKS